MAALSLIPHKPRLDLLLLDLDGVIRMFDPKTPFRTELLFDLQPGILRSTAFSREHIDPVITGEISKEQWVSNVGKVVGNTTAVSRWLDEPGTINVPVYRAACQARSSGVPVALLTNGTSNTLRELEDLCVASDFDHLFNSASLKVAKPDPRVFQFACSTYKARPERVLFIDDKPGNIATARALGLDAHLYSGEADLVTLELINRGVAVF